MDLQTSPPPTECSNWENLAPEHDPTNAFDSEQACINYTADGGTAVDLQTSPPPTECSNWENLAPEHDPTNAFDSQQACLNFVNDGGTAVDLELDTGGAEEPVVTLAQQGSCSLVVSVSGFASGTYTGEVNPGGVEFTITVDSNGDGTSDPIGNRFFPTTETTYTATVNGITSEEYTVFCVRLG